MYQYLSKQKLIETCPPWYSKVEIKPKYSNDDITVYWDIPEYSGYDDDLDHPLRPDGKVIKKNDKIIYVLEMTVPWIENRETKEEDKVAKYKRIVQSLKVDHQGFDVKQLTFVIDCLAGYSKSLPCSLRELGFTEMECEVVLLGIQKIVVTEAVSLINHFKILTME